MFGELIKLRELGRLLRQKRYEAALDLAREPAIREHRKAQDAAESARKAIVERAEQYRQEGRHDMALKDVRRLIRDGEDARTQSLEKAILERAA